MRSEPSQLWTTDADLIPLEQAQAPHEAETLLPCPRTRNGQRARTMVQRRARARHLALRGTRRSTDTLGMTTAPLNSPVELTPGMVVRARVRTTPARPVGTWTSWAIALPGADWEEHDEQAIWEEIDD
mgnify:CR=1 FL=1